MNEIKLLLTGCVQLLLLGSFGVPGFAGLCPSPPTFRLASLLSRVPKMFIKVWAVIPLAGARPMVEPVGIWGPPPVQGTGSALPLSLMACPAVLVS